MLFLNESVPESTSDCCRLVNIILHLLADPFLPFVVSIKLMYVTSSANVYHICHRISVRSILGVQYRVQSRVYRLAISISVIRDILYASIALNTLDTGETNEI